MSNDNIIMECELADGLKAVIQDMTSHYYGGYFHVRLRVAAAFPLRGDWFESDAEYDDVLRRLGPVVCFTRTLEKMAVREAEVDAVMSSLMEAFESNVFSYLAHPDFPRRFVLSEYAKACKSTTVASYNRS